MKVKFSIVLLILVITSKFIFSQIPFSQFFSVHLQTNPANTGNFNGDYRIGGTFRNENAAIAAVTKYSFFGDWKMLMKNLPENDQISMGIYAAGEKDVYNGIKNNYIGLSLSYFKSLNADGTEKLGIGFQSVLTDKKIEPPLLVYGNQIDAWLKNGFSGINPFQRNAIEYKFLDLDVGLNYSKLLNAKNLFSIGLSVLHANKPSKTFVDGKFSLPMEIGLQSAIELVLNSKAKFCPQFWINYTPDKKILNDLILGGIYQIRINESRYKMTAGLLLKNNTYTNNSLIPVFGIKYINFDLKFSYDILFSREAVGRHNAFEASLIYIGMKKNKLNRLL